VVIVLCTHHKGGAGKTELAIHVTGVLRQRGVERTLLIDCDSQSSAWEFHSRQPPDRKASPRIIDPQLTLLWNPERISVKKLVADESYDHVVLDLDSPLENTVQTIVQSLPELILIPVNLQAEAVTRLRDPIAISSTLEKTIGHTMRVRIIPLGAKVPEIRKQLEQIEPKPTDLRVMPRVRDLQKETNRARREGRYSGSIRGVSS
jgi:chromosome partitioning protein